MSGPDGWLNGATRALADEPAARVRSEIEEHDESAGRLIFASLGPAAVTEWTRASIRRKLPVSTWPRHLYL
jgi:hypothetical protein